MEKRNSRISAASLRLWMMNERSAGATVNTCKEVFNQHFVLSINKVNSMEDLTQRLFSIN
jgi:hypothetical protein